MIINKYNENGKKVTICTMTQFVEMLTRKVVDDNMLFTSEPNECFPDVSFAAETSRYGNIEINKETSLDDLDVAAWFGIKPVKGFNSCDMELLCNYWGGGAGTYDIIYDGMSEEEIQNVFRNMIERSTSIMGYKLNPKDIVYVEWGDVTVNIYEVHEIEDKFAGTPRYSNTCTTYEDALELYEDIIAEGNNARLLLVDKEGMPIYEIKSNY